MVKKIDITIDKTTSGFGKDGKVFSHSNIDKEIKAVKGTMKKDGSGKGIGANKGRGGCKPPMGNRKGKR